MADSKQLIVKVAFPAPCPIASKTFTFDSTITVAKALEVINESIKGTRIDTNAHGLYITSKKMWLQNDKNLKFYEHALSTSEQVDYRDRNAKEETTASDNDEHAERNKMMIQMIGVATIAVAVAVGGYFYYKKNK